MVSREEVLFWFGSENGLARWNRVTGQWKNYRNIPDNDSSLANNMIRSVYIDSNNILWVGSEGGLDRHDRNSDSFFHYELPVVMWMHEGSSGVFWLATKGGLYRYDKGTDQFKFIDKGFTDRAD